MKTQNFNSTVFLLLLIGALLPKSVIADSYSDALTACKKEKADVISYYQSTSLTNSKLIYGKAGKSRVLRYYQGHSSINPAILYGFITTPIPKTAFGDLMINSGGVWEEMDSSRVKKDGSFCIVGNKDDNTGFLYVKAGSTTVLKAMISRTSYTKSFNISIDTTASANLAQSLDTFVLRPNVQKVTQYISSSPDAKKFVTAFAMAWKQSVDHDEAKLLYQPTIKRLFVTAANALKRKFDPLETQDEVIRNILLNTATLIERSYNGKYSPATRSCTDGVFATSSIAELLNNMVASTGSKPICASTGDAFAIASKLRSVNQYWCVGNGTVTPTKSLTTPIDAEAFCN